MCARSCCISVASSRVLRSLASRFRRAISRPGWWETISEDLHEVHATSQAAKTSAGYLARCGRDATVRYVGAGGRTTVVAEYTAV